MKGKLLTAIIMASFVGAGAGAAFSQDKTAQYSSGETRSGYLYTTPATQSLQDDDFANPAFLWVDQGEQLWTKVEGEAGKSCASCHQDAAQTMKSAGVTYPKYDKATKKPINIEQRINLCRTDNMKAKAWKWESSQLLAMTAYVKHQSRGMPMKVSIDGPLRPFYEKGKKFYNQRRGLLDMACATCHVENAGNMIRADLLSQGQANGFPTYRLKWQKLGSLHRRFRGCNKQVRATPYKAGSDEYVNLELFLSHRSNGLKVESPSVRR